MPFRVGMSGVTCVIAPTTRSAVKSAFAAQATRSHRRMLDPSPRASRATKTRLKATNA